MKMFRICSIHNIGGLAGTVLKRKFVNDPDAGRCSFCKSEFYIPEADMKVGDVCKKCKTGIIKPIKIGVEYCPDCEGERKRILKNNQEEVRK